MGEPTTTDLGHRAAVVPLVRDVVVVEGPEAVAYLQGQLSQDVEALALGASAPSLLLQPTGKVDAWLRATRLAEDGVALDVDAGAGEGLEARLRRFLLRTKATLTAARWRGLALRGPAVDQVAVEGGHRLPAAWPGLDAVDVLGVDGTTAGPSALDDPSALEALRIACGVPAMGAEITEATIPAELGQWLIDASVSFTKGCYTGQELVARIDSRGGRVPHPVRGLRIDGPVPESGAVVRASGAEVGRVTSAAADPALGAIALAPLARAVEPGAAVTIDGPSGEVGATVAELPLR
jgi:folate-binding protein YgfZ